jgi:hypothetical protein
MRIHEVDALDDALDLDRLRAIETAEAVMGERDRLRGERDEQARGRHEPRARAQLDSVEKASIT